MLSPHRLSVVLQFHRAAVLIAVFAVLALLVGKAQADEPQFGVGGSHSAVIFPDGSLWVGGSNYYGQLGDGTSASSYKLKLLATEVAAAVPGDDNTFWIKTDRTLWATGNGSYGALGDGLSASRYVPVQVASSVAQVAAGGAHMAFVKTDGTLWTSGANGDGQLGIGTTSSGRTTPGQVATDVSVVAAGSSHTVFLKTNGTLWAMGYNYYGQLGDGSTSSKSTPVQIASEVTAVSAGPNHTLFIKTDGTLWAMGSNNYGQLGDGTTAYRLSPVQVATEVAACAAGATHSAFIKTDGTLWTMGENDYRQLGDGGSATRYTPFQVATGVTAVAAGGDHTLWRNADGIWAAGYNYNGDFGLGDSNSLPFPVRLIGTPVITTVPVPKTVNPNNSVTFSVTAYGPGPFTYAWRRNNSVITGATSSSYSFTAQESLEGDYTVTITGRDGATTSTPVTLSVNDPVVINPHPQPQTVMPGQSASFSVAATGTGPLTYQWRKNGSSIPNETNPTLSFTSVTAADASTYTCAITNVVGTVTSNGAALVVGPAITASPQARVVNAGSSTQFAVTATGTSLAYQWRRGEVPIPGATSATYTFTAQKNLEGMYDVVVSNAAGSVSTVPVMLSVNAAVSITTPPAGAILQPGQPLSLTVAATGAEPRFYQWRKDGVAIGGETNSNLNISGVSVQNAGSYTCAVMNIVGTVTSAAADVRVGPAITAQPVSRTVNPDAPVTFSVTAVGSGTLSYEWRKNGTSVGSGPAYTLSQPDESDEGTYSVSITSIYGSITSVPVQLLVNDKPKIKTHPQSASARIGAEVMFTVEVAGTGVTSYQWRHEGTPIPNATQPFLGVAPVAEADAGSYDVIVTSSAGSTTSLTATLSLDRRPHISRQPRSVSGRPGASVSLSVEAIGEGEFAYQWFRDGVPVQDATSSVLIVANLAEDLTGNYSVAVNNAAGQALSATAAVTLVEWTELAGTFQALFLGVDDSAPPYPGRLTVTVTGRGSLSGRLEHEGLSYSLSGVLSSELQLTKVIQRPGRSALEVRLMFSVEGGDPQLTAEVADAGQPLHGKFNTRRIGQYNRENPAPQAGRYVALLDSSEDPSAAPTAPGYALVNVGPTGAVTIIGKLPDRAKLSHGGFLAEDGLFPAYQRLYRPAFPNAGFLAGPMSVNPTSSDQAVQGSLHWSKPAQVSGPYSQAFSTILSLRGTQFVPPATGEVLLDVPQGSAGLVFLGFGPQQENLLEQPVRLSTKNLFTVLTPNPTRLSLKLDARTGFIRGTFNHLTTRKSCTIEGVLLPGLEAAGFFSVGDQSGSWAVEAN